MTNASSAVMTIQLGLDTIILAGFIAVLLVWLGAILEYVWLSIHHRHH